MNRRATTLARMGMLSLMRTIATLAVVASPSDEAAEKPPPKQDSKPAPLTDKQHVNSLKMKLVRVPAGDFWMGSREPAENVAKSFGERKELFEAELPMHQVTISKALYFGQCEVTVGQFREFVKATKHKTAAEERGGGNSMDPNTGKKHGDDKVNNADWSKPSGDAKDPAPDDHPVRLVSHDDAVAFCAWLSKKEGRRYRLPTEAEWEYACRAGSNTRFHNGDDVEKLVEVANVPDATYLDDYKRRFPKETLGYATVKGKDGYAGPAPVGKLAANAFGLHDVHGNVWEWCSDWYAADTYARQSATDPRGPDKGEERVIRGGCFM